MLIKLNYSSTFSSDIQGKYCQISNKFFYFTENSYSCAFDLSLCCNEVHSRKCWIFL